LIRRGHCSWASLSYTQNAHSPHTTTQISQQVLYRLPKLTLRSETFDSLCTAFSFSASALVASWCFTKYALALSMECWKNSLLPSASFALPCRAHSLNRNDVREKVKLEIGASSMDIVLRKACSARLHDAGGHPGTEGKPLCNLILGRYTQRIPLA
jgi:hypothetical protein